VTERGAVEITGRRDDMIISGGVNLDPGAIEAAIRSLPGVEDAVVVGRPHPKWGQRPVAVYVGAPHSLETIRAVCRDQIGRFAAPDAAYRWDALPTVGPLGKRSRSAVARQLQANGAQSRVEGGRALERAEVFDVPEGVLEPHGAVDAEHELEGHRPRRAAQNGGLDVDGMGVAHGLAVVGLDVHERHGQTQGLDAGRPAKPRVQQLFETDVRVLERPTEEDDADAIHLVEPRRDGVTKPHESLLRPKGRQ
jgi:hypothetical protein